MPWQHTETHTLYAHTGGNKNTWAHNTYTSTIKYKLLEKNSRKWPYAFQPKLFAAGYK